MGGDVGGLGRERFTVVATSVAETSAQRPLRGHNLPTIVGKRGQSYLVTVCRKLRKYAEVGSFR